MEGGQYFVALRMRPDAYAGPEGSPTNYLNLDIETAQLTEAYLIVAFPNIIGWQEMLRRARVEGEAGAAHRRPLLRRGNCS